MSLWLVQCSASRGISASIKVDTAMDLVQATMYAGPCEIYRRLSSFTPSSTCNIDRGCPRCLLRKVSSAVKVRCKTTLASQNYSRIHVLSSSRLQGRPYPEPPPFHHPQSSRDAAAPSPCSTYSQRPKVCPRPSSRCSATKVVPLHRRGPLAERAAESRRAEQLDARQV